MPPSGYVVITIAISDLQEIDSLRRVDEKGRYIDTRQDIIRRGVRLLKGEIKK